MVDRTARRAVAIASSAAVLALLGGVALGATVGRSSDRGETQAGNATEDSGTTTEGGGVDYCPTDEEMRSHWRETGQELKPTVDCPDPDPEPTESTRAPEASLTPTDVDEPKTLAEAQILYDPENDPFILIDQKPDGSFSSIHATPLEITDETTPPAWVQTVNDFEKWIQQTQGPGS